MRETSEFRKEYKWDIVWRNVFILSYLHGIAIYAIWNISSMHLYTIAFIFIQGYFSIIPGLTGGVHRLFSHKAYKVRTLLKLYIVLNNLSAFQGSIYNWSRDHRCHHKFSETDADPHNAKRGFFFSHVGWLLIRKHPEVIKRGKEIDMSDLENDPIVMFQHKYYMPLGIAYGFILPTVIPLLWGESLWMAYCIVILRYVATMNFVWSVNSFAHLWGDRPYDININPAENWLVILVGCFGEGFHNYHHTFPYDYCCSAHGMRFNVTTMFINAMEKIGLAYDLRQASDKMIKARIKRTGYCKTDY